MKGEMRHLKIINLVVGLLPSFGDLKMGVLSIMYHTQSWWCRLLPRRAIEDKMDQWTTQSSSTILQAVISSVVASQEIIIDKCGLRSRAGMFVWLTAGLQTGGKNTTFCMISETMRTLFTIYC